MMADLLLERAFCLTTSMFSADFDLHKAAEWLLLPELMNKKITLYKACKIFIDDLIFG